MNYLGFEPRTYQLKAEYSTIELVIHYKKYLRNSNKYKKD